MLCWDLGAAECLAKETAHLGIRTHILVLGQFRTNILDENSKAGDLRASGITEYDHLKTEMSRRHMETHGKQPGDPAIAAQKIVDIVRLENLTEDERRNLPLRIPLGTDALCVMRLKCAETLETLKTWEAFAASTDFPDASAISGYVQ
jgi:hypothetical protein